MIFADVGSRRGNDDDREADGDDDGTADGDDEGLDVDTAIGIDEGSEDGFADWFEMLIMNALKRLKSMDPRPEAGSHPDAA